jgi:hypothetical protein
MLAILGIISWILIIWYVISSKVKEREDRKNNPEKWMKIDEETAVKFLEKYRNANLRIPRSRWILFSKKQKSLVYLRRERLQSKFRRLNEQVKKFVIEKNGGNSLFSDLD